MVYNLLHGVCVWMPVNQIIQLVSHNLLLSIVQGCLLNDWNIFEHWTVQDKSAVDWSTVLNLSKNRKFKKEFWKMKTQHTLSNLIAVSLFFLVIPITIPLISSVLGDDMWGNFLIAMLSPAKICGHWRPSFKRSYSSFWRMFSKEEALKMTNKCEINSKVFSQKSPFLRNFVFNSWCSFPSCRAKCSCNPTAYSQSTEHSVWKWIMNGSENQKMRPQKRQWCFLWT